MTAEVLLKKKNITDVLMIFKSNIWLSLLTFHSGFWVLFIAVLCALEHKRMYQLLLDTDLLTHLLLIISFLSGCSLHPGFTD